MARTFAYQRSIVIDAPRERIATEISDLSRHANWSPFCQPDPRRRDEITGAAGVGQSLAFSGGRSGAGRIVVDAVAPDRIDMTLTMLKPMKAVNHVVFLLQDEPGGLRVTWSMSGEMTLIGRLMDMIMNCEAMVGRMFDQGLAALKAQAEGEKLRPTAEKV